MHQIAHYFLQWRTVYRKCSQFSGTIFVYVAYSFILALLIVS